VLEVCVVVVVLVREREMEREEFSSDFMKSNFCFAK
jgi:hypothetical protein